MQGLACCQWEDKPYGATKLGRPMTQMNYEPRISLLGKSDVPSLTLSQCSGATPKETIQRILGMTLRMVGAINCAPGMV